MVTFVATTPKNHNSSRKWNKIWTGQIIYITPFLAMLGSRAFCELWPYIAKGRNKRTKHLFSLLWCFITYLVVPLVCWDLPFVFVHLHLYLWLTSSSSLIFPISSTQNKFTVAWFKSCLHGSLAKSSDTIFCGNLFFFAGALFCMGWEEAEDKMQYSSSSVAFAAFLSSLEEIIIFSS